MINEKLYNLDSYLYRTWILFAVFGKVNISKSIFCREKTYRFFPFVLFVCFWRSKLFHCVLSAFEKQTHIFLSYPTEASEIGGRGAMGDYPPPPHTLFGKHFYNPFLLFINFLFLLLKISYESTPPLPPTIILLPTPLPHIVVFLIKYNVCLNHVLYRHLLMN